MGSAALMRLLMYVSLHRYGATPPQPWNVPPPRYCCVPANLKFHSFLPPVC